MSYTYEYPRPAVTADMIVLTDESEPKILLIQRGGEPFKGCWAFPGGFMDIDETTEECARRELKEETGLEVGEVKQVGAYSAVNRDPRGRTITVAYVTYISQALPVAGLDDAAQAKWWPVNALPPLAFDHTQILQDAFLILKQ